MGRGSAGASPSGAQRAGGHARAFVLADTLGTQPEDAAPARCQRGHCWCERTESHTRVPQGRRRFTAALFGHGEMKKLRFQRHCVELTEHTSAHERDRRQKMAHGTMPPARRSGTGTTAVRSADGAAVPGRGEQGAGAPRPAVSEGVAQMGQLHRDSVALGSEHVS